MRLSEFLKSSPAKFHGAREQYTKNWLDWEDFQNLVKTVFDELNVIMETASPVRDS